MKLPPWLKPLNVREEKKRAAEGLTAKRDGWYKSVDGKVRYIAKPMTVTDVLSLLPARLKAIRQANPTNPRTLARLIEEITVERLVENFLAAQFQRVGKDHHGMRRRTYDDYVRTLAKFAECVGRNRIAAGIGPSDFSKYMATIDARAKTTIRREVQYIDRLFNWSGPGKNGMNWLPFINRGPAWIKPSAEESREGIFKTDKALSPSQLHEVFELARDNPALNAFAHLALNCAFIPKDIAELPDDPRIVDLDNAEIRFARGKTGVSRLCPLMPETVKALRRYIEFRDNSEVENHAQGLFFRTRQGRPYYCVYVDQENPDDAGFENNNVSRYWSRKIKVPLSSLRSTFATFADDWHDERAIDVVMGHKVGRTGRHIRQSHYAKKFKPERARALVEYVWKTAFPAAAAIVPSIPADREVAEFATV